MASRHDQLTAWNRLAHAARTGPLDERTCRLVELAIAIGAHDRDAVRAAHQQAIQYAMFADELEQIVALAATTLGKHATLATYGWLGLDAPSAPTTADAATPKPSDA